MSASSATHLNHERWAGESASPVTHHRKGAGADCGELTISERHSNITHMSVAIKESEPLAHHTVFRIGGPARFFVTADNRDDLVAVLKAAKSSGLPWMILGAGSNVLVSDRGFPGMVIRPMGGAVEVSGSRVLADAAVPMARVVAEALAKGLRGFEWAIGVPGTVGGSVRGNAGCFGSEMKDVVRSITVFDTATGNIEEWSADAAEFGYRDSIFKRRSELVILAATVGLIPGDPLEGQRRMREHTAHRTKTQDIGLQSAGCAFKNIPWSRRDIDREKVLGHFPELPPSGTVPGISAGFLVDQAGLRGYQIGGAKISERHGNFILNTGRATAEEVIMLLALAKEHVHRRYGLLLEEEIQYIGF